MAEEIKKDGTERITASTQLDGVSVNITADFGMKETGRQHVNFALAFRDPPAMVAYIDSTLKPALEKAGYSIVITKKAGTAQQPVAL